MITTPTSITIARPDDFHAHLRDNASLATTVPHAAQTFARVLCMPNLKPPVTTVEAAKAYAQRITAQMPESYHFEPLMTLYATDTLTPETIQAAADCATVVAVKLYPAGATTNSDDGVTDIRKIYPALAKMQALGLPLLVHGEVTDSHVDIFDREQRFLQQTLQPLLIDFPELKVVLEHITTRHAADFVLSQSDYVAATITPQHLLFNRNQMLVGGIKPHYYCLPILKRASHQEKLREVATSGNPKFFLGTDSAPHQQHLKQSACGCAGCYSMPIALSLYAQVFSDMGKLDKLEGFASHFGADFYGLPRNTDTVTLVRQPYTVPTAYAYPMDTTLPNDHPANQLVPLAAEQCLDWQVTDLTPA